MGVPVFRVAICLLALISMVGRADEAPPLPSALAGETRVDVEVPFKRQFAPAVRNADGSVLVFSEDNGQVTQWRLWLDGKRSPEPQAVKSWTVPYTAPPVQQSRRPSRFASIATAEGTWLIGPSIELSRPDGSWHSDKFRWARERPEVAVLADGSVVVLGGEAWPEGENAAVPFKVERLRWVGDRIEVSALPDLPAAPSESRNRLRGFKLVALDHSRLMVAGGGPTWLLEPGDKAWRQLKGMAFARANPALLVLPDGRVWASGGDVDAGKSMTATTSELWDPVKESWQPGPDLPMPMVEHQALLSGDRKTAYLAGGYFPSVLGWTLGADGPTIAAEHAEMRRNASVFLLPGDRMALLGGRHARTYDDAWGRTTPGVSIITPNAAAQAKRPATWPTLQGAAVVERGGRLLAIGGRLVHTHTGSAEELDSRLVERHDLLTGRVSTLRSLPIPPGRTQAVWVDERTVLVHAEAVDPHLPDLSWDGLIDVETGAQTSLPAVTGEDGGPIRGGSVLLGRFSGRDLILTEGKRLWWRAPASGWREPASELVSEREGFVTRITATGRLVVAGGNAQVALVAVRDEACPACLRRYVGFGPLEPARHYEFLDLASGVWRASAPTQGEGGPAAILTDGRVVIAEDNPLANELRGCHLATRRCDRTLLELSAPDGGAWRVLPLPEGKSRIATPKLMGVQSASPGAERMLFMRGESPAGGYQWWVLPDVDAPAPVWKPMGGPELSGAFPSGLAIPEFTAPNGRGLVFYGSDNGVIVTQAP